MQLRTLALTLAAPFVASCAMGVYSGTSLAAVEADLVDRSVDYEVPAEEGGKPLRIATLAGTVSMKRTDGASVRVTGRLRCDDSDLLNRLEWKREKAEGGWTWSFIDPEREFDEFHYPGEGYSNCSLTWFGRQAKVSTKKEAGVPTLMAEIVVEVPAGSSIGYRQALGGIDAESLNADLELGTGAGDIEVASHTGSLVVTTGSGDVVVQGAKGDRIRGTTGSGDLRMEAMTADDIELATGSGDVGVEGLESKKLVASTGSGDVSLGQVKTGDADFSTGSGEVKVQGFTAQVVAASTGSGTVHLDDVDAKAMTLKTGSGEVYISGGLASAEGITARTGSGSVRILGGPEFSFDAKASIGSGSFKVGYDDAQLEKKRGRIVRATRGDARTKVEFDVASGSVKIAPR